MKRLIVNGIALALFLSASAGAAPAAMAGTERAAPNQAQVRFVNAVPGGPAISVAISGGPVLVSGLTYPNTSLYVDVTPGVYDLELRDAGSGRLLSRILGWQAVAGVTTTIRIFRTSNGAIDVSPMANLPMTGELSWLVVCLGFALFAFGLVLLFPSRRAIARIELALIDRRWAAIHPLGRVSPAAAARTGSRRGIGTRMSLGSGRPRISRWYMAVAAALMVLGMLGAPTAR